MPQYIPPHRRSQAIGASASGAPADTSLNAPPPTRPHSSDPRDGRGHRGPREQYHGSHRGGPRGGYGGRKRLDRPIVDDADAIHGYDIAHYFWPHGDEQFVPAIKTSTFHDSAAQLEQLSYMMLFCNANPRWDSGGIVFAKSSLNLLPEYSEQKLQNGLWVLPATTRKSSFHEAPLPKRDDTESQITEGNTSETPRQNDEQRANTNECTRPATITTSFQDIPQTTELVEPPETHSTDDSERDTILNASLTRLGVRTIPASDVYSESATTKYPSIMPIDYIPGTHPPIAVFEELKNTNKHTFIFLGWYSIGRINIIAPHSAELVRMLQQKWERRDRYGNVISTKPRDASAWKSSMTHEWAIVKFDKLPADVAPPAPIIPKRENDLRRGIAGARKGVTELLQEMRLSDGNMASSVVGEVKDKSDIQQQGDNTST
ncbi:hypothetical protein BKA67DRAFT_540342 [Truncatella angustata]|uniref:Uncharacterized protein n=1 Tax=Truncatella angustata TaxID=152316 RepID=A0A9P8RPB4_9PEZI|nr:uncharacterized protein BKA67DRAFT_540342 [Truncatella angustata]KAH6646870.1 hypothetical protein BKA67DRAFT_540342 [Truncatella angustata]